MELRPFHSRDQIPADPRCTIYLLAESGRCPVQKFLEQLESNQPKEFTKLTALLDRCINHGIPANPEKVRNLGDKLNEFKTGGGIRIFWFWDENRMVVCAHGIIKKSRKTPKREIETARNRKSAYEKAKKENKIKILPP